MSTNFSKRLQSYKNYLNYANIFKDLFRKCLICSQCGVNVCVLCQQNPTIRRKICKCQKFFVILYPRLIKDRCAERRETAALREERSLR